MSNIDYTRALPAIQAGVQGLANLSSGMDQTPSASAAPTLSLSSSSIPERPQVSGRQLPPNPNQQAMLDFARAGDREMARLNRRKTVFTLRNQITEQVRYQEQMEADLTLAPLVADLSKFASSGNWAGLYAKRREIMENPLYFKSKEVANQVARLDADLARYGTEVTTDGRSVNFNDVTRMVGSGDPEMQKEGLRILALRSENGLEYVQQIPLSGEAAKDPLFRFHLRTFIKENPRIDANDYELYESAKKFYFDGIKQQYKNDPKMAAAMMSSPQTQEELKALRESLLRNKTTRDVDWAPPSGNNDQLISDSDMSLLRDVISQQISDSGRGFFGRIFNRAPVTRAREERSTGLQQLREQSQPQLAQEQARGAPPPLNPAAAGDRAGLTPSGTGMLAGGLAGGVAATSRASEGLSFGRRAARFGKVGGAAGVFAAGIDLAVENQKANELIRREQLKAELALDRVMQFRSLIKAEVNKPQIDDQKMTYFYDQMSRNLEEVNSQMASIGLEYRLSPLNLFSQKQFQIISTKAARQQASQAMRSGLMPRAPQSMMGGGMGMAPGGSVSSMLSRLGVLDQTAAQAE